MARKYRTNADDSIVCPHRDLSCCPACLAADERLVDVYGAVWLIADPAERAALRSEMAAAQEANACANPACPHLLGSIHSACPLCGTPRAEEVAR